MPGFMVQPDEILWGPEKPSSRRISNETVHLDCLMFLVEFWLLELFNPGFA